MIGRRELWNGEEGGKYRNECNRVKGEVCKEKMYVSYKGLEHPHGD